MSRPLNSTDLDAWRQRYLAGDTTIPDHRALYGRIVAEYPEQRHFAADLVLEAVRLAHAETVVEIGGWDGELAEEVLRSCASIRHWTNYEIAPVEPVCGRKRYEHVEVVEHYPWERDLVGDLFVASHVLEHLTRKHFEALLDALHFRWAYVDVPIGPERSTWGGSMTTHVLDLTIGEFDAAWLERGWQIIRRYPRPGEGYISRARIMRSAADT